jgi:hypothetical protein
LEVCSGSDISTDISETEYRISITIDVQNADGDESEPPVILLHVKYPDEYPDEAPILDLSAPHNAPSHPYFNISEDKDQLLEGTKEVIEENMGMAMIFTIVSTIQEAALQLVTDRQEAERNVHEQKLLAAEREENKKFHGTPVTPETFVKWREDFIKEMEEERIKEEEAEEAAEKKKNRGKESVEKLTGKQLWERGLVGKVDEEDDGEDGIPVGGIENLKVEA